jgi:amino acid transporter
MVIAYGLVCSCVWAVLQTLSEMTIAFPTSGNYIDYADRWVDPALAFGAGFAEWLGLFPFSLRTFKVSNICRMDFNCGCRSCILLNPCRILGYRRKYAIGGNKFVPFPLFFVTGPDLSSVTIFLVATLVIFLLPNTVFAWFEYVTSIIKILLFLGIILLSLCITLGAGSGGVHDGSNWTDFPAFKNGFSVSDGPLLLFNVPHPILIICRDSQTACY